MIKEEVNSMSRHAGKFRKYADEFRAFKGKGLEIVSKEFNTPLLDALGIDKDRIQCWPYAKHFTEGYSHDHISFAVYESPTAENWQRFRVSLQGLSTSQKLYCLMAYWEVHVAKSLERMGAHPDLTIVELVRINNYLGALKRGGQLSKTLDVLK